MTKKRRPRRRAPPHKRRARTRREATADVLERADDLLDQDRAAEVVTLLEPVVEAYPRSADAHYFLGYAYAETGDPWGGITEIERALSLGGDRRQAVPLVRLYAMVGLRVHFLRTSRRTRIWLRDQPGFDAVQEAVSLAEEDIAEMAEQLGLPVHRMEEGLYHMEEGELSLQQNDWAASIAASRRAVRYLGDWPPPHNNLSMALFYSGQPEDAVAEVRRVLSVMPDNIHALSNGIRFLAWAGREDEARDLWAQLRTIETDKVDLQVKMAEAAATLGLDKEVYRLMSSIDQEELDGELGRGLGLGARRLLAIAEANLGRRGARRKLEALKGTHSVVDEVLAALEAGKPGPGWSDRYPYYYSGDLMLHEQLEAMLDLLQQNESVGDERTRRELQRFTQRYPQAVLAAEKLIWEEDMVDSGLLMLRLLDTPEARAALRRFGLSQAGEDEQRLEALQALIEAGEIGADEKLRVWLRGQWQEIVMRQLEIAEGPGQELAPAAADLLIEATEADLEGDDERAEGLYYRVLELEPRSKVAYANLGTFYIQRGEVERGKEMLRKALEIDPLHVQARSDLALLLLEEGDIEAAEAMLVPLGQVTRFHPEEMAFYSYVQARIHVAREEFDAARNLLELSLDVLPDFEPSQDLLERIELRDRLQGLAEQLSKSAREMAEQSQARRRSARLRLQRQLTTPSPRLAEALPLYTKNALTHIARAVIPSGGWSSLNKAPLIERIAETLLDTEELARVVADLDEEARAALREVVQAGGTMPWAAFDARHDNDFDQGPEWTYSSPHTVMGQLRLHGLLVETTVDGEVLVAVPAELRAPLGEILR
jgi:tetratricopeptide (TPR) repeat protein